MSNISDKVVANFKTHIICYISYFPKTVSCMRYVELYGTAREATDDNRIRRMLFASWTNKAKHTHTHTHSEYVILFTATMVKRTHFRITLHVHCLYCFYIHIC